MALKLELRLASAAVSGPTSFRIDYLQKVISRYESVQKIEEERQISETDHRQLARALALTNLRLKLLQSACARIWP